MIAAQRQGSACFRAASIAGLILFDGRKKPIYFNSEALQILTYPLHIRKVKHFETLLPEILRSILRNRAASAASRVPIEFQSGKRHYLARIFSLDHSFARHGNGVTGLLFERAEASPLTVTAASERFRLTPREQETVALLTVGLTSKEIAGQLNVSTNTVKTFVRSIMTKMAVPTRAAIVGKLIGA